MVNPSPAILPARPGDEAALLEMIVELAAEERLGRPVTAQAGDLTTALFGAAPAVRAAVATVDGQAAGFVIWWPTYSTVTGRAGAHIDDLYVRPPARGLGLGRALMAHVAAGLDQDRTGRLEWWALRHHESALRFYRHLGAEVLTDLAVHRLAGEPLDELAGADLRMR